MIDGPSAVLSRFVPDGVYEAPDRVKLVELTLALYAGGSAQYPVSPDRMHWRVT